MAPRGRGSTRSWYTMKYYNHRSHTNLWHPEAAVALGEVYHEYYNHRSHTNLWHPEAAVALGPGTPSITITDHTPAYGTQRLR